MPNPILHTAHEMYSRLNPQQRLLTLCGSAAAFFLIAVFFVLLPLQEKIDQLRSNLPVLETQLAQMQAQPQEFATRSDKSAADLRSALYEILAREKIHAELRVLSNGHIEISASAASIQELLALSQTLRDETGVAILAMLIQQDQTSKAISLVLEMGNQA